MARSCSFCQPPAAHTPILLAGLALLFSALLFSGNSKLTTEYLELSGHLCLLRCCPILRRDKCRWIAQNPVITPIAEMVAPASSKMSVYHWESAADSRKRNIPAKKNTVEKRIPILRFALMDAWLNPASAIL